VAKSAFPVPPIHPFSNYISVIDAGFLQAVRNSRKAPTTRHGTRCREMKALEMNPIVIGDAFRIDSS
jgi:hypothetical protein